MKKIVALLLSLVMVLSMLTVAAFAEDTNSETENDETIDVNDADETEEPTDSNPTTGIALAVLPMVVAAAGVVASKKH
ncbi:MAG: hypothetical protein LUH56_04525 [Oscillospiraceae bacterium]|nr:hypothetical protein [Oscillospiraceae bacterium]